MIIVNNTNYSGNNKCTIIKISKEEITEKVTNHTNKLIVNIENKFRQVNENIERRQEEALEMVFDKLERTLDNINRQNNLRSENGNPDNDRNSNNNNIPQLIFKTKDNKKIVQEDQIQSQQKKEKQQ